MRFPYLMAKLCLVLLLAFGAPVTRSAAEGLHFAYEPAARFGSSAGARVLAIRGEVQPGDYERFTQFIRSDPDEFVEHGATVVFVVDGGDVEEAMRIGELLRDALLHAWLPDVGSTRCLSACFFMFAIAVSRDAIAGSVGIHRPYIDAQRLADADPEAVRSRYRTLTREVNDYLDELSVPRDLVEIMLRTPWNDSYRLSRPDLERLGAMQPWFEDFIGSKCGVKPAAASRLSEAEEAGFESEANALRKKLRHASACANDLLRAHRRAFVEKLKERAGAR